MAQLDPAPAAASTSASPTATSTPTTTTTPTPTATPTTTTTPTTSRVDVASATLAPAATSTPRPTRATKPVTIAKPATTPGPASARKPAPAPKPARATKPASAPKPATPAGRPPAGYPSAVTTGARGALTVHHGDLVVGTAGATIKNLDIRGSVLITADRVILRNVKITTSSVWPVLVRGKNVTIEDSTIVGTRSSQASIGDNLGHNTFRRLDLSGAQDGIKLAAHSTLADSFVHDLASGPGLHNDGIELNGTVGITVRHNTVLNANDQTSAIFIGGESTPSNNILVEGNLFAGGGYTMYGPVGDPGVARSWNVVVRNNVFSARYFAKGGKYGPLAYWENGTGSSWSNNSWADGARKGQSISVS